MAFDSTKPSTAQSVKDAFASVLSNLQALFGMQNDHAADQNAHGLATIRAGVDASTRHIASQDEHGLPQVRANIAANSAELLAARGTKTALAERLGIGLNADGSLKLSSIASKWINNGDVPTYVGTTSFSVSGDRTGVYIAGVLLRFDTAAGYLYAPVASRSYAGGVTTIQLDPAYAVLSAAISAVSIALIAWDNAVANAVTQNNASIAALQGQLTALKLVELTGSFAGKPTANQVIWRRVISKAMTLPAALAGAQVLAVSAATASTVMTLMHNGVAIGQLSWAAGATAPTLTLAATTALAVGDVLTFAAPATPDATLADLVWTLQGALA